jgi:hypothetical protein
MPKKTPPARDPVTMLDEGRMIDLFVADPMPLSERAKLSREENLARTIRIARENPPKRDDDQ